MKNDLVGRLQPLADRMAADLAGLITARVDALVGRMVGQIEDAFDVALSAIATELDDQGGAEVEVDWSLPPETSADPARDPRAPTERDVKPAKPTYNERKGFTPDRIPPSRRAREDRGALQANGKKPVTCKKCGFVGGNARGCGSAHQPLSELNRLARPVEIEQGESDERDARRDAIAKVARKRAGALPKPTSSFEVDHETGEVRELDFGGADNE